MGLQCVPSDQHTSPDLTLLTETLTVRTENGPICNYHFVKRKVGQNHTTELSYYPMHHSHKHDYEKEYG